MRSSSSGIAVRTDYLIAWLLPMFAGAGVFALLSSARRRSGDIVAAFGAGWLVGIAMAALLSCKLGAIDTSSVTSRAWPWLAGLGALAWIAALIRSRIAHARRGSAGPRSDGAMPANGQPSPALIALCLLLIALVLMRVWLLADEASLRPLFPWDAWSAWAIKAKTWMLLGEAQPYVKMVDWLTNPDPALRTAATWRYPEGLAWMQVWFASGAGEWNEPLVNLAWCGALVAFALAAYGYWRGFGLSPWLALALVYAFVSLPLVDAHVALAGYADLWLAVMLGAAVLAWTRWMLRRERGQWLLAVALALTLPAIKLEGSAWLFVFSIVVVLDLLPARGRRLVGGSAVVLLAIGLIAGGFVLPVLGVGPVHVSWKSIGIPLLGSFDLVWHPVGGAMLAGLFTLPNWHLLWYAVPAIVIARHAMLRRDHASRMLGLLVLLQAFLLFVLFFFTDASAWAQDYTSANRLILQIVPTVFVFIAVLLREGARSTGFSSSAIDRPRGLGRPISAA